jgi:small GTP-binding protein
MTSSYFAGANAVIIVFDLSNKSSFDNVEKWMKEAKRFNSGNQISFLLIGNKSDLSAVGGVQEAAKKFAAQNDAIYCETSAKTGDNVANAFFQIGSRLKQLADGGMSSYLSRFSFPLAS